MTKNGENLREMGWYVGPVASVIPVFNTHPPPGQPTRTLLPVLRRLRLYDVMETMREEAEQTLQSEQGRAGEETAQDTRASGGKGGRSGVAVVRAVGRRGQSQNVSEGLCMRCYHAEMAGEKLRQLCFSSWGRNSSRIPVGL